MYNSVSRILQEQNYGFYMLSIPYNFKYRESSLETTAIKDHQS